MSTAPRSIPEPARGEPVWQLASLWPDQGYWPEDEYLLLTDSTNRLIEYRDGFIEVLAMPTTAHQRIVLFLYELLRAFLKPGQRGEAIVAPLRVRLRPRLFREPDVAVMLQEHSQQAGNRYWTGADLVMEVVSDDPESHHRDWETKRREYAEAGIPEHWIVDPHEKRVVVLKLVGGQYEAHYECGEGDVAESALLPGFTARVDDILAAGRGER